MENIFGANILLKYQKYKSYTLWLKNPKIQQIESAHTCTFFSARTPDQWTLETGEPQPIIGPLQVAYGIIVLVCSSWYHWQNTFPCLDTLHSDCINHAWEGKL